MMVIFVNSIVFHHISKTNPKYLHTNTKYHQLSVLEISPGGSVRSVAHATAERLSSPSFRQSQQRIEEA